MKLTVFNATEARQNFFRLLRLVERGEEVAIVKKDQNLRFKVSLDNEVKISNKDLILKEVAEIGLKSMPIRKMKAIFESFHDL